MYGFINLWKFREKSRKLNVLTKLFCRNNINIYYDYRKENEMKILA
ncbi:hypothetical protein CNEO4_860003 [Clostridium neonatale]|uniref:Uncharacterized protein n=1 Tax=Clostridium neonatale TaxID=137838 RepID=A0AA86MSA8_9CLOT|nr:hypothetical protein CNEO_42550 [Clostridium neonatale]CAI3713938.1 hypothetical protein CNEO4_920002 [Clostridium neonatale]CAI3718975.1 hypothetical protein CNEO4_860003 [Clostridium neonatale]CAI3729911.1 hypothetical protein CNEO4_930011 [Clostridium neonatale]CAI4142334.1 hypothetical protein CNEO4_910003 [Clostridium neonatale]